MHVRTHHVSRIERVASFAVAFGVTAGTVLLILAGLGPSFVPAPVGPAPLDTRQLSEHVVYVAAQVRPPMVVATREAPRLSARTASHSVTMPPARTQVANPFPDSAVTAPTAVDRRPTATPIVANPTRVAAGAPAAAAMVAIKHASSEPVRIDSLIRELSDRIPMGIVIRPPVPPPFTQAEKDAKWRDEAFEAGAARGAGVPVRYKMAGGSIPIPLPFGGPSRKQRERDRVIYAELKATVARRQKTVDSLVAARRRRADSLHRDTTSQR